MVRLLIHGTSHGKKTSRQLPKLKILIVRESGGSSYVFSVLFIADFQHLKDVFRSPALSGEILDKGVDGGDRSDGGSGGCGRSDSLGIPDHLGAVVSLGFSLCLRGPAFICAMSFLAASKAKSFSDASSTIRWGELFQVDGVDLHGIRVLGGM